MKKNTIYLDNSATTPTDPRVISAMSNFMKDFYGNPSSIHSVGRSARAEIDKARDTCREFIGADHAGEIVERGIGIRTPQTLLEGAGQVVVAVSPVIGDAAPQGLL